MQLKIGIPFPNFKMISTNGKISSQQDMQGKITVINFWFGTCAPCIAELGAWNQLYLKFKDNPDFQFISFTFDSLEIVKGAIKKFDILYDVYPTTKEECERLFCNDFPTNVIVDQNGKIAYIKAGGYPNGVQVQQMELLTAFLLKENNWKSPYSYSVSTSFFSDSLNPNKPFTMEDIHKLGLLKEENKNTIPIVGRKYVDFNAMTLAGKNISQKQLLGKITVIDIWHQYCSPCIAEFEFFNKLYLDYKENSAFQLFSFTYDTEEDAKKVIEKHNLLYDVACIGRKECYRLNYNNGFPTILIINPFGIISYFKVGGYIEKEKVTNYFENLKNEIDNLLKN